MAASDVLLLTSQFLAAGLFLLLAGVLLAVRFNSRVNRAFAVFLFLRGVVLMLQAFGRLPSYADDQAFILDVARYFALATPFAVVYFVALYQSPQGGLGVRVAGLVAILGAISVEALYLLDHDLAVCQVAGSQCGALVPVVQATPLAQGLAGLVLALSLRRLGENPRVRAVITVAAAFSLLGILEGAQAISLILTDGGKAFTSDLDWGPWLMLARIGVTLAFLAAACALALLVARMERTSARVMLVAASIVVLATTLYQLRLEDDDTSSVQAATLTAMLFGTWRLLGASLVTYALVRHRFLDLDLKINWTISRGTVLAVFVAAFLVVFKVIENALNSKLGILFGGVATGLLMLAIKPLERLGDRVASEVHPRGDPKGDVERLALFREQAMMVWADGRIGRKERLLLDNLRERLGVEIGKAAQIEHEAALAAPQVSASADLSSRA